jgi:hypothetical protein
MIKVTLYTPKNKITALKIALEIESAKVAPPAPPISAPPAPRPCIPAPPAPVPVPVPCGEIMLTIRPAYGKESEFLELVLNSDIFRVDEVKLNLE